jgi:hypothetical protein
MYTACRVICGIYETKAKTDLLRPDNLKFLILTLTRLILTTQELATECLPSVFLASQKLPFQVIDIKGNLPAAWPMATSGTFQKAVLLASFVRTCAREDIPPWYSKNVQSYIQICTTLTNYLHVLAKTWERVPTTPLLQPLF